VIAAGITPERAGNTTPLGRIEQNEKDHPRARGEYVLAWFFGTSVWWITPERAGNTWQSDTVKQLGGDHPRARGEY